MANGTRNRRHWPEGRLLLFAALGMASLPGCGKLDRVEECRTLAAIVNPRLDAVEAAVKVASAKSYREAAKLYRAAASDLRKQPLPSPGAQQLSDEYLALLSEVAPVLDSYAAAVERKDAPGTQVNEQKLARIGRIERPLVARIGAYCSGR